MNLKNRIILEDYRKSRADFVKLGEVVHEMLHDIVEDMGIQVLGIEHRVKSEKSLAGKLDRHDDWYTSLEDLTDILGARVICFFNDEIDKIGKRVEEVFLIDWENSSDKRALINADTFGYLSLHYICSLPFGDKWPDEICGKKFEIQIRTVLQHAWSDINHDLGYKSEFGVPRAVSRQFARVAALLEVADAEFVRARNDMKQYTTEIRRRIVENQADDVPIDMVSLREYVQRNMKMRELLDEISEISHAEIREIDPESYLIQLKFLGKETLGDMQVMMEENRALALKLAETALANAELDILSSSVGLRFLCRAELLKKGYPEEKAVAFLKLSMGTEQKARRQARYLFSTYNIGNCETR
ncbi:MAG: GTP pyrophosphokinase family protein [Lachnospiraceae bacterium]